MTFHASEVNQPETAIGLKQIIAGMLVGVDRLEPLELCFVGLA